MNDDLGDVFRHLADEAPSADGLLAGVHTAASRAAVRRRVLLASAAALVLLIGGIGVVSATGDGRPSQDGLVVDGSATPTPEPTVDDTPSATPSATATRPPAGSTTYHGRAVSPEGEAIAGLYVHVIPEQKPYWFSAPVVAQTDADGEFDIPCPDGVVLLSPFRLGQELPFDTPNWRITYVGGGYLLGEAERPSCADERRTTEVPEGGVVYGALRAPADCKVTEWAVHLDGGRDVQEGHIAYDQYWLRAIVAPGAAFRLAGLPPGTYTVYANDEGGDSGASTTVPGGDVTVTGPGRHEVDLDLDAAACGTATPTPEPSGTAEPTLSPAPAPSATESP